MENPSVASNGQRRISGVRLIYSQDPSKGMVPLEEVDRCTRLIMELKEEELLSGVPLADYYELYEMEELGIYAVEDDEDYYE